MNKALWLKRTNPLLLVVLIVQAASGVGHEILPEEWFEWIHPTGGLLLVLLAAVHLTLNWNWVKNVYLSSKAKI